MTALLIAPLLLVAPALSATQPPTTSAPPSAPPPATVAPASTPPAPAAAKSREPFKQPIPAAAYSLDMRPVPGSADGSIKPFYMSATEITWDAFDTYIYRLDEDAGKPIPASAGGADAVTRPSKPYLPPDRGFGHEGYPAITMSFANAKAFCVWLSAHSGKKYRLATEQEWEHAARGGVSAPPSTAQPDARQPSTTPATTPDKSPAAPSPTDLADCAWVETNSSASTHPVAKKKPNALGLFDMLGNVREWCIATDGAGVARGGGYIDPPGKVTIAARDPDSPKWNASDPQIPRSKWWLADGPFIGFRIVCEIDDAQK